jgi:hypothetical protein
LADDFVLRVWCAAEGRTAKKPRTPRERGLWWVRSARARSMGRFGTVWNGLAGDGARRDVGSWAELGKNEARRYVGTEWGPGEAGRSADAFSPLDPLLPWPPLRAFVPQCLGALSCALSSSVRLARCCALVSIFAQRCFRAGVKRLGRRGLRGGEILIFHLGTVRGFDQFGAARGKPPQSANTEVRLARGARVAGYRVRLVCCSGV